MQVAALDIGRAHCQVGEETYLTYKRSDINGKNVMTSKIDEQTMPLTGKRQTIVEAATLVFARYGFARTSMADLSEAVGMSRTALYPFFRNKGDVFDAVIRHATAKTVVAIRNGLALHTTLEAKLRFACVDWIVHGYEFVHAMPDASDQFDLKVPAVRDTYGAMETLLVDILAPYAADASIDIVLIARTATASFRSFKDFAVNTDELRRMIDTQINLLVDRLECRQ